jgi:hypothetical protein
VPAVVLVTVAMAGAVAPAARETCVATASVKTGAGRASAPFSVTITRYADAVEREALLGALRTGGPEAARAALAKFKDAGVVQLGAHTVAVKFAGERPTASGRLVTIVTAEPILFLGAGLPEARPRAGYDVAVAILDLNASGGFGELAPAAKLGLDDGGALHITDYGDTVIWLKELSKAR